MRGGANGEFLREPHAGVCHCPGMEWQRLTSRRRFAYDLGLLALAGAGGCATTSPTSRRPSVGSRAACSSLCRCKQSTEVAFAAISRLGFRWLDLSCLSWAPHVAVPALVADFEAEATRLETILALHRLQVANLTFDAVESRPWEAYESEFGAVAKLAARLRARLINLMAPSVGCDRTDQVAKLRRVQELAAGHGVILTVETHVGQLTEQPADAVWLCQQVPGLKLTLDPSHYFAGPHQGRSLEALYPLVEGTGFRAGAMSWESIQLAWGAGPIDFTAVIQRLEAHGYRGFYVAEYLEGLNQVDAVEESGRFLAWIKRVRV